MARNYDIKIQSGTASTIETTLDSCEKFGAQCLRWVRTTWRPNPASLFTDRTVWRRQPWCVYAVYLTSLVNFALFYDLALLLTLRYAVKDDPASAWWLSALGLLMFLSKLVKPLPHYLRNPWDIVLIPFAIMFSYYHSLIKLYALFTFWNTEWSGRKGVQ